MIKYVLKYTEKLTGKVHYESFEEKDIALALVTGEGTTAPFKVEYVGEFDETSSELPVNFYKGEQTDENVVHYDNVKNPVHYNGKYGMQALDVVENFIGELKGLDAYCWGNTIKYLLRFQNKNGVEDLKKAKQHLEWLIGGMENENTTKN